MFDPSEYKSKTTKRIPVDKETWEPIIKALLRQGKSNLAIKKAVAKNSEKTAVIVPADKKLREWIIAWRQEIKTEAPPEPKPKKQPVFNPTEYKIPAILGACCGSEFQNIPGWTLPEHQPTEAEIENEKATYQTWKRLLMYAILNFWGTSKLQRLITAHQKAKPLIPTPTETQIEKWVKLALVELELPILKAGESRESQGYNKAILLWKGTNKFPEHPYEFKNWRPVGRDYSAFSFKTEDDEAL